MIHPVDAAIAVKSATGIYTAIGAMGTLLVSVVSLGVWWIRGKPDRTRADSEAAVTTAKIEETANAEMTKRMLAEISRLDKKVTSYGKRIDELERDLGACHRAHETTARELGEAKARILELEALNQARGTAKQEAQQIVALDRLEQRANGGRA